jgi:hypothetical protein
VSNITKISFTLILYKYGVHYSLNAFFESVNGPMDFFMVSEPRVFCDDGHFPPLLFMCLAISCHT